MNIVFMGYAVDMDDLGNYTGASVAGNKMQTGILKALNNMENVNLYVFSLRPNAAFPHDKSIYLKEKNIKVCDNLDAVGVKYCNFPVIKQYSQYKQMYRSVDKLLKTLNINDTILFTFNMFPQIGMSSCKLKKKYGVKLVSLLADLPIDDANQRDAISAYLRKQFDEKTENCIKQVDGLVVLNKHAVEVFAPGKDYIIVDGGIDSDNAPLAKKEISSAESKRIMYCGALTQYSGILTLVEAMKYVKSDVVLDIYGQGDVSDIIEKEEQTNPKVKFWGRLPFKQILEKQKEAYLLVNPRPTNDPISMVTFPSKMFEYMLSGTPVVSTKLNGFTQEYFDKLFFFEDETSKSFAKTIDEIMTMDYENLCAYSEKAHDFIVNERNWKSQTDKICGYLDKVLYKK